VVKKQEISPGKNPDMFYKRICRLIFLFVALSLMKSEAQSGSDQKKSTISSIIQSRNYIFMAQSATTQKGKTIQLSYGYDLKLMNDSLSVYLPYYGRAYNAGYQASNDIGVEFNTRDFTYSADTTKKQGWEINIKPTGVKVSAIFISVSSNGYSTVRVNSNNRAPISYYGTITENPAH
jgi:Domain of unknown function (DUF4251)